MVRLDHLTAELHYYLASKTINISLSTKLMHQCSEKLILFLEPSKVKSKIG
jgi:hypothetical protein